MGTLDATAKVGIMRRVALATVLLAVGLGISGSTPEAAEAAPAPTKTIKTVQTAQKPPVRFDGKTPASARRLAQQMTASRGWNRGAEWRCLFRLWQRESGWRYRADNKYSSAYGIAQMLNTPEGSSARLQIARGLRYVSHRYGTPCAAWQHSQKHGWY